MKIEYLAFEGGGVKAYAYVGVMKYFSEQKISLADLKAISGSSIGAFTALCIVLKYDFTEFNEILADLSVPNFLNFYTICKSLPNLIMHYGAVPTTPLIKLVDEVLSRKNIPLDVTFKQLYDSFAPVDLIITGSNVNCMETKYFNYKNTPDMKIKDACVISMSYPILFTPTLLNNDYFCDGGLYHNIPLKYMDLEYEEQVNSIGMALYETSDSYEKSRNFIEYLLCLLNGIYNNSTWSDFKDDTYKSDKRICQIPIPADISSFYVTDEQKQILTECGYMAIKKYMDSLGTPTSAPLKLKDIEAELNSHILPLI
jgi:NTE family protein